MTAAVGWAVLLAGVLLILVSAVGLHRFRDVASRQHAAAKASTTGVLLVLAGTAMRVPETRPLLLVAAVLLLLTVPAGAHLLVRASYRAGDVVSLVRDDLASGALPDEAGSDVKATRRA